MLRPMMVAPMLSSELTRKSLSRPSAPPSRPVILAKYLVAKAHSIRRMPSLPKGASSAWPLAAENPSNEMVIQRATSLGMLDPLRRSSVLVFLQHPAQQVQLLADAMDPHLGALRVAVKVRAVLGHAHQGPCRVGQELHRGERDREALAGGGQDVAIDDALAWHDIQDAAVVGDEGAARRRALLQLLASHAEVEAVETLAPVFGGTEPALAVLRFGEITVDLGWRGRIAALQREGVVDQGMLSFHRRLFFSAASSSSSSSPRRSRRLSNRALRPSIHFVTWSMAPKRRRQCRVRPCL